MWFLFLRRVANSVVEFIKQTGGKSAFVGDYFQWRINPHLVTITRHYRICVFLSFLLVTGGEVEVKTFVHVSSVTPLVSSANS